MFRGIFKFFKRINKDYYFDYFLVFVIALVLFSWLQVSPALPEPDSFYHAKVATILSEGKVLKSFPWLQETNLKENFVDHHFLYHLFLAPFVRLTDPLIGVKVATVIFSSLLVLAVYWLFKKFQLKFPLLFLLFLLTSQPWLFRASLVKAPAVFLIFFILAFYLLVHQKWLALFTVSFLSVWLYAGWPLLLVLAAVYLLVSWLLGRFRLEDSIWYKIKQIFKSKKQTVSWKGLGYVAAGLMGGLVVNPYFPANLNFYWQQIVKIALVNYQTVIGVGGEWYPYGFMNLISDAPLVCALLVVSLLLFALTFKKQSIYTWVFLILTLAFFVLTLKSRRQVEFFIPLAVIFSAFCFSDYFKRLSRFHLGVLMHPSWQIFFSLIILVFGLGFALQIPTGLAKVKADMQSGRPLDHYQASGGWLKANTPRNSIVFNTDWDDFPALFYQNSHNFYLTGLDPTFMYERDNQKYRQYADITLGNQYRDLKRLIKNEFKADYVFLDKKHDNLERLLRHHVDFKKVYEDSEAIIYQVINNG